MQRMLMTLMAIVATTIAMPLAGADAGMDLGKREYENSCALCHGPGGKGDGAFGELLQLTIPDLTTLSSRNGGVFPTDRVYAVIDGREEIKAHGLREMPIWGKHLAARSTPEYDDYPHAPEALVRARILALIDFLDRCQVK
jgi:mono/diheme cytochrome c family protein